MKTLLARFSAWQSWRDRKDNPLDLTLPGVYMLAEFDRRPSLGKPILSPKIFYIGETCGALQDRFYSFQRSAFENKFGHSGGSTYYRSRSSRPDMDRVYFSAMPVDMRAIERDVFIRYAERALLWGFFKKHRAMPWCNRK